MAARLVDIPLNAGLRQKTSEQWLDPSSETQAINAIWNVANGVEKRPGYLTLANQKAISIPPNGSLYNYSAWLNTAIQGGVQLFPSRGGAALTDGWYVYGQNYGAQSGELEWSDFASPCVAIRRTISAATVSAFNPTVVDYSAGAQNVFVWESGTSGGNVNQLCFSIVDQATGATIRSGNILVGGALQSGAGPRAVMCGSVLVVIAAISSANIAAWALNLATPNAAWFYYGVINSNSWNHPGFEAVPVPGTWSGTNQFALVYANASGGLNVQVYTATASSINTVGLVTATVSGASNTNACAVNIVATSGTTARFWIGWASNVTTPSAAQNVYAQLDTGTWNGAAWTFATTSGPTNLATFSSSTITDTLTMVDISTSSTTRAATAWHNTSSVGVSWCVYDGSTSGGSVFNLNTNGWGLTLCSRLFAVTTPDLANKCRVFALVSTSGTQQTQILAEFDINNSLTWLRPVAVCAPRLLFQSSSGARSGFCLSGVTRYGSMTPGVVTIAGSISETSDTPACLAVLSMSFDFLNPGRALSAQVGNLTYLSGGFSATWDGQSLAESSTLQQVAISSLASTSTGGSVTNGQAYSYVFVPEWRDGEGNVHQGQPSAPVSVTTAGSSGATAAVTGNVSVVSITAKGTPMRQQVMPVSSMYLVPYRTAFLNGAMSTNYYRAVGDQPGSAYINAPLSGGTISFSDTASDATIAANELLPTTGGVLEADAPSSFAAITQHAFRIYGIGDDLRTIWISTAQVDGVPCWFTDGSQTEVSFMGDLVAVWSMDSNLYVGNATGMAYASGSGPNITGTQSDLSPWTAVPTDVGPIDPRAVCVTPIGTIFRHTYGLGLLDRSLAVHSEWGDPVQSLLQQYPTVTAIELHPRRPEVHIFCTNGTNGTTLVFNYRYSAWSQHLIYDPDYPSSTSTVSAIPYVGGNFQLLSALGRPMREQLQSDNNQFFDQTTNGANVTTWIPLTVTSAWVKPGGLQGQGFLRTFNWSIVPLDNANWTVTINYDYGTGVNSESRSLNASVIQSFPDFAIGSPTSFQAHPHFSRATAVQVAFSDSMPSITAFTGQGARITGITAEVEAFEGPRRVAQTQRY